MDRVVLPLSSVRNARRFSDPVVVLQGRKPTQQVVRLARARREHILPVPAALRSLDIAPLCLRERALPGAGTQHLDFRLEQQAECCSKHIDPSETVH